MRTPMSWKDDAIKNLHNSLHPVKVELNELDWKSGLSENRRGWLSIFPLLPTRWVVERLPSASITMLRCSRLQESRPKRSSIGLAVLPGTICISPSSWNMLLQNMKDMESYSFMSRNKLTSPFIFVAGPSTTATIAPPARPTRCPASRFTT